MMCKTDYVIFYNSIIFYATICHYAFNQEVLANPIPRARTAELRAVPKGSGFNLDCQDMPRYAKSAK